ncbi:MAG: archaetidylserine decarboxylase [Rhodanobacteraceae bacterium]|nr:archaetidylserine decarboxylase [Pseudomonadota bacterium]
MSPTVLIQYLLPQKTLSRVARAATRWTWRPWKDFLIARVIRRYRVDMNETVQSDPRAYPNFNAFFTRALKTGARVAAGGETTVSCPADGCISQAGHIVEGRILQAKGQTYSVAELLADETSAAAYREGSFVTVYLSPRDYHRVHMPLDGELAETVHVPGRLFSVAPRPVEQVPRLFARNERLICHFEGAHGPFVVALVGAMLVSGITTVWHGAEVPPYAGRIVRSDWRGRGIHLARFAEMARFEMGSTVILLLPPGSTLRPGLLPQGAVKLGQRIGAIGSGA